MTTHYQLPAEWAPQSAVLLTWPQAQGPWGEYFHEAESTFLALAGAITRYQPLIISCHDEALADGLRAQLLAAGIDAASLHIAHAASNDVWVRDHGPITVIHEQQAQLLDFRFNGWGGKFPAELDNQISRQLQRQGVFAHCPLTSIDCVLEGGAIETDGQGVMLTTKHCLPLSTRNPGWSLADFEALFARHFGIHTTHWLEHGHLAGDDTDGHIDTLARFADSETLVFQGCQDPQDEHYAQLSAMHHELAALRTVAGHPYRLHALPLPAAIYDDSGQRLPASYANFLIINGAVLLPTYNDPADEQAALILKSCFPDRDIVCIDCRALIRQYGSLHCVTMQIPAQVPFTQA